jgi:hypothetical protein
MRNLQAIKVHLAASQIKRKTFNNSPHLVLPVVMLTEGVHNGSDGPLYYPPDELLNSAHLWDGKPVLVNHPTNGGMPISANNPRVWEGQVLGQVWNSRFDGKKLVAEIWLHEERTRKIAPELLKLISLGANIDVSTGLFTNDERTPGIWNGEKYTAVARRHVPDHLAILPTSRGACSWADGCGIRSNSMDDMYRNINRAYESYVRNGGQMHNHTEEPLLLPTLNDSPLTNKANPDEYDMNISRLWRKS